MGTKNSADLDRLYEDFLHVQQGIAELFKRKNKEHGGSFFRGDLRDLYFNMRRKYYRFQESLNAGNIVDVKDVLIGPSLVEDLRDMAAYAVMGILMIHKQSHDAGRLPQQGP